MRYLARTALVLSVVFFASRTGTAAPPPDPKHGAAPLGTELLLFERAVRWEAVSSDWARIRPAWMEKVAAATDPRVLAGAILELESHMGWDAVVEKWRTRRDPWVTELKAATTMSAAARLLLELEAATRWEAVQPGWKDVRPGWVERVGSVARQK